MRLAEENNKIVVDIYVNCCYNKLLQLGITNMPKETNVFYRYEVIAADDNTMFFLLDNDTGRILKNTADKTLAESLCFNYNHIPNYDHFNVEEVA